MAKTAEGKGRCGCCGELITWRKNETGTMSYFCQDCDFQGYAKFGSLANRLALEEVEKFKASGQGPGGIKPAWAPAQAPKPAKPEPAQPPKPATQPQKAGSGLLMG